MAAPQGQRRELEPPRPTAKAALPFVAIEANPEILDVVRAEGVDFAQGYLVGKPMPFGDFIAGPLNATTEAGV